MLYDQQKVAGIYLTDIEARVADLRRGFTEQILRKHVHETEGSVDKLF